jgi:UDP-GlcNAc3NAcA epimerase
MIKILTVVGARPQIIKAAALSRAINNSFNGHLTEVILHTGQHYDQKMSNVFFDELKIPAPNYNLNIGSASHGVQTARMIEGIEDVLASEMPACLVLYGDTNSTLAGAIAATKLHIPVVHIEAGLRSFSKTMPEEINRIVCDHCSTLLFSPTRTGYNNLVNEGFKTGNKPPFSADNPGLFHCGDVMYDNTLFFLSMLDGSSQMLDRFGVGNSKYILATLHRPVNTDHPERLEAILKAFDQITKAYQVKLILPLHPRTAKMIRQHPDENLKKAITQNKDILITEPVSFLEMMILEKNAEMVITDSGGVQKEAFFLQKPCIVLRNETEWVEIVEHECAILTDADENRILEAYEHFHRFAPDEYPQIFGDGKAAEFICRQLINNFS